MFIKKIYKYIIGNNRYYHKDYGFYTIKKVWMRTDYNKKDTLIVTDDGLWYTVPYEWLISTSEYGAVN